MTAVKSRPWAGSFHMTGPTGQRNQDQGFALLAVLFILLAVTASSASFMWFMNQQQARAGGRFRAAAALAMAEAGVHRALSILEHVDADGRPVGRAWRAVGYTENLTAGPLEGRFTLSLSDSRDGAITVVSVGEAAGTVERLRARVSLASPVLLAALYGRGLIEVEGVTAVLVVMPYGAGIGDRPWAHFASERGISFSSTDASVNDPATVVNVESGPTDALNGAHSPTRISGVERARIVLAQGAELMLGEKYLRTDALQLRAMGVRIEGSVRRVDRLPPPPDVDSSFYATLARENNRNVALNKAAGDYFGDVDLARKHDSLYAADQFERLLAYLREVELRGVVYVGGSVWVPQNQRLRVREGSLVVEGTLHLDHRAEVEIVHSAVTRTLPGVIVLEGGALMVSVDARLRAHGLVYVTGMIDVSEGANFDIVGAVVGNDRGLSFRNRAAAVIIRYDPAVLGTPGLWTAPGTPMVAWVVAWEEVP